MTALRLFIAALALLTLLPMAGPASAQALEEILRLERVSDGKVRETVTVLASGIDPNQRSSDDRFALRVNDRAVDVPEELLSELAHARRLYSYDHFTGGITSDTRKALCMMGGPAVGDRLVTRYLRYTNTQITGSELRPVLSEARNCLFADRTAPQRPEAERAAAKAMATLQTLLTLYR